MRGLGLLPGCEAPGIVTPFLILADQIGERIRPPERGDGALGIERAQQDAVDRPVLVDPALGDRVLVAVFRRRGERNAVGFTVTVPADAAQAALLQDKGFANAFALRCLPREVSRNLWSQAEFDTVTAKKLCELREQFWKDTVQLSPERMAVVLQELYARGATIVSNEHGYGIYFRKEDTLYFVEMMADSDRAAEILMEAAREKEVIVEKAVITVGAAQPLFLGEGTRQEYGMIRFDAEPFDVSESYLRLMLEN